ARASDTEIPRLISSGSKSVVVVPSSTRPFRLIAPAWERSASARVVFPVPPCPTRATLRLRAGGKVFTPTHLALGSSCWALAGLQVPAYRPSGWSRASLAYRWPVVACVGSRRRSDDVRRPLASPGGPGDDTPRRRAEPDR